MAWPALLLRLPRDQRDPVAEALAEAKHQGVSFDVEDIQPHFTFPFEEDARPELEALFKAQERIDLFQRKEGGEAQKPAQTIAQELFADTELLAMLDRAASKPHLGTKIKAPLPELAELSQIRQTVKLLCLAARGEAQFGNLPVAEEYLRWAARMTNFARVLPGAISALVYTALDAILCSSLLAIQANSTGSPETLQMSQRVEPLTAAPFDLRRVWPFEGLYASSIEPEMPLMDWFDTGEPPTPTPFQSGRVAEMAVWLLRHCAAMARAVDTPDSNKQFQNLESAQIRFAPTIPEFARGDVGYLADMMIKTTKSQAAMHVIVRVATSAFAGVKGGVFPDQVAVPKGFLLEPGQVKYRKLPNGFSAYWIGLDGVDNGGPNRPIVIGRGNTRHDDMGFRYEGKPLP